MNQINQIERPLSRLVKTTSMLILVCCLIFGAECRNDSGCASQQRQKKHSQRSGTKEVPTNTRNSETKADLRTGRLPVLPADEERIKVDTMTLEILEEIYNSWVSQLNEPNEGQIEDSVSVAHKKPTENPDINQKSKTEGR